MSETNGSTTDVVTRMGYYRRIMNGEVAEIEAIANDGDVIAMKLLADCYAMGEDVEKNDAKAQRYFRMAADKGNVLAAYCTGINYYFGSGTVQDYKEAGRYLSIAADHGHAPAQVVLGDMYKNNEYGLFGRKKKAFELYTKAANQGFAEGQYKLAGAYIMEIGTSFDMESAMFWLVCARVHGDNDREWSDSATYQIKGMLSDGYRGGVKRVKELEQEILKKYPRLTQNPTYPMWM